MSYLFGGLPSSYDAWKTACCERYPNCNPCPYDEPDEEEGEEYDFDEEDEDID